MMLFLTSLLTASLLTACICSDINLTDASCVDCNVDKRNFTLTDCEITHIPYGCTIKLFTMLKRLNLRNNFIKKLTNSSFEGFESLTILDLSENLLTSLPDNLLQYMPSLKELYITGNPLAEVSGNALRGSNLTELNIKDNMVPLALTSRALADMSRLTYINLKNCSITTLPTNLLDGSNAVKSITLSNNHIKYLPADLFANKTSLNSLSLDHNELHELSPTVFADLATLTVLDLSFNQISEIQAGTFSTLNELYMVDIQHNRLRVVSPEAFSRSFQLLLLSGNELTTLETKFLSHLVVLFFGNNSFSLVESLPEIFPLIENLPLLENVLTRLTESDVAILANFSVKTVYFADNIIVTILVDKNPTKTSNISVDNAPLHCDCLIYDFAKHVHNNLSSIESTYCAKPASLKNPKLKEVLLKDFVCPYESCPDICECIIRQAMNTMEMLCQEPLTAEEITQLYYLWQKTT